MKGPNASKLECGRWFVGAPNENEAIWMHNAQNFALDVCDLLWNFSELSLDLWNSGICPSTWSWSKGGRASAIVGIIDHWVSSVAFFAVIFHYFTCCDCLKIPDRNNQSVMKHNSACPCEYSKNSKDFLPSKWPSSMVRLIELCN